MRLLEFQTRYLYFTICNEILTSQSERIGQLPLNVGQTGQQEILLTPSEVAKIFRVDPKTVTRWAKAGKLTAIRTLGGHRRYRKSEVLSLLEKNLRRDN